MNPRVVNANALDNYQLLIKFSDGESGVFDFTPYFEYPAFDRLRDKGVFGLLPSRPKIVIFYPQAGCRCGAGGCQPVREAVAAGLGRGAV